MTNRGKDHEADEHPKRAGDERLAASVVLHDVETDEGGAKIDGVENDLRDEGVDVDGGEDGGSVVEEVVGTSELLGHLEQASKDNTVSHARCLEHANELGDGAALDLRLGTQLALDLLQLSEDGIVVLGGAIDAAEGSLGLFDFAHAVVESRGLGESEDANAEDDGPQPTEADDDSPRGRAMLLVGDSALGGRQPLEEGRWKRVGERT